MKPITLQGFAGSNSFIDPLLLPESVGVNVIDCEPGVGNMRPLKVRATVATVPSSPQRKSIWRMGRDVVNDAQYWLSSSNTVNWTTGFGTDATERTYYTGDGSPRWTNNIIGLTGGAPYPQAWRELSVPAPVTPATVSLTTDGSTGTQANRYYLHTFVNDIGWESAPSPVSAAIFCKPGANVAVSALPAAPAGAYGITLRRVYRTQPEDTTTGQDDYFQVGGDIAIGTTTLTDNALPLGALLATFDGTVGSSWTSPPTDGFSLHSLWGSMYAMLSGKEILFSVQGAPYAYPIKYRYKVKDTPVALAVWEQNCLVLTVGKSVLFQGGDPASMQDIPQPGSFSCSAARGVVSFPFGAVWPSAEGLACSWLPTLLTLGIVTADQWKALVPSTMVAGRWGRFYVCAFNDGTSRGFIIDPMNPADGMWYLSSGFDACHYDPLAGELYVLEGANVRKFNAGPARLTGTFTGKRFLQAQPNNYGYAQVVTKVYPVTLNVTARWTDPRDGSAQSLVQSRSVANSLPFPLKAGFLADDWQPEVVAAVDVEVVRLAREPTDFLGV